MDSELALDTLEEEIDSFVTDTELFTQDLDAQKQLEMEEEESALIEVSINQELSVRDTLSLEVEEFV